MSDPSTIRERIAACTFYEVLDIASGVLHILSTKARLTDDRWSAVASVLRRHGVDPEGPTGASDLDHRLREVSNG